MNIYQIWSINLHWLKLKGCQKHRWLGPWYKDHSFAAVQILCAVFNCLPRLINGASKNGITESESGPLTKM